MGRHVGRASAQSNRRGRRTQADRSAATRARILDAVVETIDAVGFVRTTSQRIARGAGVSVGAVQHHFPAKDDILAAVLERSLDSLFAKFEGVSLADASLEDRVGVFVERAWLHYGSAAFRSTLEILLNFRNAAAEGGEVAATLPILASARGATRLWGEVFANVDLSARQQREIRQFAFASLSGLAMTQRLQVGERGMRPQIELLKTALLALFVAAGAEPASRTRAKTEGAP